MLYSVISDGACALLVSRNAARNRVVAHRQVTKGYYWNSAVMRNEIIAAYFPTARNLISHTLAQAGLTPQEVGAIIPHNVSLRSWEILLGLLGIEPERLFADNISRIGHVIAADNWINLKDAGESGRLYTGQNVLLFNFGYGANWSCTVLEH
jgi:3-oxoacyl-[acyl-carrier-protein] synthase-3